MIRVGRMPLWLGVAALFLAGCSQAVDRAARPTENRSPQQVFESGDGAFRLDLEPSWFVTDEAEDEVGFANFRLSAEEEQRRADQDIYGALAGEGTMLIRVSERLDLQRERDDACRQQPTTLAVHECTWITVDGYQAAWVLTDHSNDGNCTCREMIINGPSAGYRFSGGGCIDCAGTPAILQDLDAMFRSVSFA